jgi:hypothetical protein
VVYKKVWRAHYDDQRSSHDQFSDECVQFFHLLKQTTHIGWEHVNFNFIRKRYTGPVTEEEVRLVTLYAELKKFALKHDERCALTFFNELYT